MLNYLFRNNSNNNGVYLSLCYDLDHNPIEIKKSSTIVSSIASLKKEVEGSIWYSQICEEELISKITDLELYYSVTFNYISGEIADYRDGYLRNKSLIEKALNSYCEIWSKLPSDELVIHGDLSIDNLIFTKNNVVIIDWEHFTRVDIPIGFDALNLIYEQVYFSLQNNTLNNQVFIHIESMFDKLTKTGCLDESYLKRPLSTVRDYISDNSNIWGEQISKLPIMKLRPSQVNYLDNQICFTEI